jgi:hypothetical protein
MEVPTGELVTFALGALVGSTAPTYYATERLRGFGRVLFARIPYAPPPGMETQDALEAAAEQASETVEDGEGGQ